MKTIILLHGLHMHSWSMFYLIKFFKKQPDTELISFGYHSTLYSDKTLDKLDKIVKKIPKGNEIFFVGHSMGGLVAKNYLCKNKPDINATLITLGTPHKGSKIGTTLINSPFKFLMGRSGFSGIQAKDWVWEKKYKLICIAGVGNFGPSKIVLYKDKRPSDGTVFLNEAIDEENANQKIIVQNMNHTQMIASKRIADLLKELIYLL